MPLRVWNDPFMVDLSATFAPIDIVNDAYTTALTMPLYHAFRNFSNQRQSLLSGMFFSWYYLRCIVLTTCSGRAIVRLEEYPALPPGDNPDGPLVAMRFLEMFTPVKRLSNDDRVQLPLEGQLLTRRGRTGVYAPWGYNPRNNRKFWIDWIARSRMWVQD